jgi:hypothetical protein
VNVDKLTQVVEGRGDQERLNAQSISVSKGREEVCHWHSLIRYDMAASILTKQMHTAQTELEVLAVVSSGLQRRVS